MFPFVISNPVQSLHNKCCIPLNLLELIITGEHVQLLRELCVLQLEPRGTHLDAQPAFGFHASGDYTAIIITKANHWFSSQIRSKHLLAAGIERIHVGQGEH